MADVRMMFRNGSIECLNFSAYPLSGVSQTRVNTGPRICACAVKNFRLRPWSSTFAWPVVGSVVLGSWLRV